MKTKDMTLIAVMTALICIAGPLSITVGPIPLSMATFAVYLAGAVLGMKRGAAAAALYLAIGIIGIPVFSGFSGGFQKLAGMTGGYLLGYLPLAAMTGFGSEQAEKDNRKKWMLPAMMTTGTAVLYTIGTLWFMVQTGNPPGGALSLCVIPFLPGDAIKITAATLLTISIRKSVRALHSAPSSGKQ